MPPRATTMRCCWWPVPWSPVACLACTWARNERASHFTLKEVSMTPNVLKIARLPDMLSERLFADYAVLEGSEQGDELGDAARGIRALVANGESKVSRALLDRLPNLEVIVVFGVGYDGVDVQAARERGIPVTHTPDVLTDDVADFAMALLFGIARRTGPADRFVRDGKWSDGPIAFTRKVSGARLGIVG